MELFSYVFLHSTKIHNDGVGSPTKMAEYSLGIARKMKAMGMDIEVISGVTQLPVGEIKEL